MRQESAPLLARSSSTTKWAGLGVLVVLGILLVTIIVLAVRLNETPGPTPVDDSLRWPSCTVDTTAPLKYNSALRERLIQQIGIQSGAAVYLRGMSYQNRGYSDTEMPFRQESNFLYLSGYERGGAELVLLINSTKGHCILFVERPTTTYAVWNGLPLSLAQLEALYDIDQAAYKDEMLSVLAPLSLETVYTLGDPRSGGTPLPVNSTAWQAFSDANATVNNTLLFGALAACRVTKTTQELELLRVASLVSASAHTGLMQAVRGPLFEFQAQAHFEARCLECGLSQQAYLPIMGSGPHSAILHYNTNARRGENVDLLLVDAAAEFKGYCSDITRTFPISGSYSAAQRDIYNIVLAAQSAAIAMLAPGMPWRNVSLAATMEILKGLDAAGLIQGTPEEYLTMNISKLFMPHGLGHSVGLDVHDPGDVSVLREGMVMTVEPGIYFIPALLIPAFNTSQGQYLNQDLLMQFLYPPTAEILEWNDEDEMPSGHMSTEPFEYDPLLDSDFVASQAAEFGRKRRPWSSQDVTTNRVGGVRIEDILVVTADGYEYLSTGLPRTAAEVESLMRPK